MSDFNSIEVLANLTDAREKILANTAACRTGFAREVHNKVISTLDEILYDLEVQRETLAELEADLDTEEGRIDYSLYTEPSCPFEENWMEGTIELLDSVKFRMSCAGWHHTGEDRWYSPEEGEPEISPVPADELEGLTELLVEMKTKTRIDLQVNRVRAVDGPGNVQVTWPHDFLD